MKFAIPRIWLELTNRINDCCVCMVDPSKRRFGKNAPVIVYSSIPSSIAPVPRSDQLPVPTPSRFPNPISVDESTTDEDDVIIDDYVLNSNLEQKKPYYPYQKNLETLSAVEKDAWILCFAAVVQMFLGNNKEDNYAELVANLLKSYGNMRRRITMKVHMLDAPLDEVKENLGAYSAEQGKRFHQDITDFKSRYQTQYNENMMGDYIWGLIRESELEYSRKSRKTGHF